MGRKHFLRNITPTRINKYELKGNLGIGYTYNKDKVFYFDAKDFNKIKSYTWVSAGDKLVAYDANRKRNVTMHEILGFKYMSHANGNLLDNRSENIRFRKFKGKLVIKEN